MSQDLFQDDVSETDTMAIHRPLSERMRPRSLAEYVGQSHIVGEGKLLPRALAANRLQSLILYGPPGAGKTSLAQCIRHQTRTAFERINAVSSHVEDLRRVLSSARHRFQQSGARTIVFIDEIHRFNKAQQDVLMPDLEAGSVILIGATVFNPFFALTSPLLSRSLVFELLPLSPEDIRILLRRAVEKVLSPDRGCRIYLDPEAETFWAEVCDGDARRALNALEIAVSTTAPQGEPNPRIEISLEIAQESIQKKAVRYDRDGDDHYDAASAFIKSMRGSDPDAAVYWMAKMLAAGEDPRFIARRICICAAEDVGNADPRALMLATAAYQTAEFIGMPEARIPLAQAAVYVACAPKSNAAYHAIEKALSDIAKGRTLEVPVHLKDSSYPGARKLGRQKGYRYAHNYPDHFVIQDYLGKAVSYYYPTENGFEATLKARQAARWQKAQGRTPEGSDTNDSPEAKGPLEEKTG